VAAATRVEVMDVSIITSDGAFIRRVFDELIQMCVRAFI
jgi:hypothetical protein